MCHLFPVGNFNAFDIESGEVAVTTSPCVAPCKLFSDWLCGCVAVPHLKDAALFVLTGASDRHSDGLA